MDKRIDVAIGIIRRGGRLLICQRRAADPLGGYWEFPGGKQEPGESPEQCLAREIAEELAITVQIDAPLPPFEHDYPGRRVRVQPFLCTLLEGDPRPLAAQQLAWVEPADLPRYRFLPANDALIRTLMSG